MEPKYIYVHSFTKYDWNSTTHQARHYPYTYFSNSNPLGFFLTKENKKQLLEIKNKNVKTKNVLVNDVELTDKEIEENYERIKKICR